MLKILISLHSVKHHSQISILNSSLLIKTTTHHIFFYLGWGFVRLFRIKKSTFLDMPSPYILFARIRSTKLRSSHGFIYSLFFLIAAVIDPSFIILFTTCRPFPVEQKLFVWEMGCWYMLNQIVNCTGYLLFTPSEFRWQVSVS